MELQFFNGIASFAIVLVDTSRKPCTIRLCLFSHIEFEPWDASSHSLNFHRLCIRGLLLEIWHLSLCLTFAYLLPPLMPPHPFTIFLVGLRPEDGVAMMILVD